MGMGLLFVMGRRRARVAAISERVIMMSRMPRPRAILAPRLRAMVIAFESMHCRPRRHSSEMRL